MNRVLPDEVGRAYRALFWRPAQRAWWYGNAICPLVAVARYRRMQALSQSSAQEINASRRLSHVSPAGVGSFAMAALALKLDRRYVVGFCHGWDEISRSVSMQYEHAESDEYAAGFEDGMLAYQLMFVDSAA